MKLLKDDGWTMSRWQKTKLNWLWLIIRQLDTCNRTDSSKSLISTVKTIPSTKPSEPPTATTVAVKPLKIIISSVVTDMKNNSTTTCSIPLRINTSMFPLPSNRRHRRWQHLWMLTKSIQWLINFISISISFHIRIKALLMCWARRLDWDQTIHPQEL